MAKIRKLHGENTETPWRKNEIVSAGKGSLHCPARDVSILLCGREKKVFR